MPADGRVYIISTGDRNKSIPTVLRAVGLSGFSGKSITLKANYNSPDQFPATTHPETLKALVKALKESGVGEMVLAERSGMGRTRQVLDKLDVYSLSRELGFRIKVLDESQREEWVKVDAEGTHWRRGFYISKVFTEAQSVVQTCCLKTHRFGGHYTLSLKNSVGMVAKRLPWGFYDYMYELHLSPNQRKMIAEINAHYRCDLVLMDATRAFITGGPEKGRLAEPGLIIASRDRVAIDAVGAALLMRHGAQLEAGKVLELDQMKRAVELGIGVKSVDEIQLFPLDEYSRAEAELIKQKYLL